MNSSLLKAISPQVPISVENVLDQFREPSDVEIELIPQIPRLIEE